MFSEKGLEIFQGLFIYYPILCIQNQNFKEYKQEPFYHGHTCKSEKMSLPTLSLAQFIRKNNVNFV